jgi:hypothetical protein
LSTRTRVGTARFDRGRRRSILHIPTWTASLPRSELSRFNALLQRGVAVRTTAGRSVGSFLRDQLGLAPEYVEGRITTVFLDGQVVDRIDDATFRARSVLALSAAMPGLVGATLRRAGYYAAMRSEITHARSLSAPAPGGERAVVRVKLFNLLLAEVGPVLLEHGILLDRGEATALVGDQPGTADGGSPAGEVELRVRVA